MGFMAFSDARVTAPTSARQWYADICRALEASLIPFGRGIVSGETNTDEAGLREHARRLDELADKWLGMIFSTEPPEGLSHPYLARVRDSVKARRAAIAELARVAGTLDAATLLRRLRETYHDLEDLARNIDTIRHLEMTPPIGDTPILARGISDRAGRTLDGRH